uniref:Uncharacterized protein n=1 Tax=Panagrolaimus sp. PS1159 TaxID=55785 RepID=A0AC35FUJ3_9BILA
MQITKRHKIESLDHGDLFSGRLLVESFCKIRNLMPNIASYWSGEGQSPKVLNFIRLKAAEVPPGKRAHNSDIDIDLIFDRTSDVIVGKPKPISYDDISKIVKKPVYDFTDFKQGDSLWTYGALKESFNEIDLKSGTYLSAEFVNGQHRHVSLNIICNDYTEYLLSHLGPGDELLLYGKIHIFRGRKTRIFVNDPEDIYIQNRRLLNDNAIRQKTTDPQKI